MPVPDWIHKYPKVQALVQQPDDVLDYPAMPDSEPAPGGHHWQRDELLLSASTQRQVRRILDSQPRCACGAPGVTVRVTVPDDALTQPQRPRVHYTVQCRTCREA